jgi:hypothetical protein
MFAGWDEVMFIVPNFSTKDLFAAVAASRLAAGQQSRSFVAATTRMGISSFIEKESTSRKLGGLTKQAFPGRQQ